MHGKREPKKNYIFEWIEASGLSYRKLAARMLNPDGSQIYSHVSIMRIAKGEQPYSQEFLEALAFALSTSPGAILERHPKKDAEIVDLLPYIEKDDRKALLKFAKSLAKKSS